MYQGIFIDNQDSDKQFAELMSTSGEHGLHVTLKKPRELMTLAQEILAHQPDLVALDYRLDAPQNPLSSSYKAGALAQLLRDSVMDSVAEDFPIILVSQQDELNTFFDNVTVHNLFDCYFSKDILGNGSTHSVKILSLVKGYKKLIQYWHEPQRWASLLDVFQPEKLEVAYQAIRGLDKLKAPHQVARDILRYVINRQGLLLDKDNLLARLGVAKTGKDVAQYKIDVSVGSLVKITDGPFKGFEGKVSEVDNEKGKIKVLVDIFGRYTPVTAYRRNFLVPAP